MRLNLQSDSKSRMISSQLQILSNKIVFSLKGEFPLSHLNGFQTKGNRVGEEEPSQRPLIYVNEVIMNENKYFVLTKFCYYIK